MVRYMDQHDTDGVFKDHLGNERTVDTRNDIFSHRIMVFLKGWMGDPKLIYNISLWTVNTTDQDAIFGNLGYQFNRKFSLYAGVAGNPGSRSLQRLASVTGSATTASWPTSSSGRTSARASMPSAKLLPGFWYDAMLRTTTARSA